MNRAFFASLTILCLVSVSSIAGLIHVVKADGGTVYIRADGSIDPPTAPISTIDNVTYTFTGNINGSVVVERNNMTLDGAGYTVQGSQSGNGLSLTVESNVTIKNTNKEDFGYGIHLIGSSNNTVFGNNITCNPGEGIELDSSSNNTISENNVADIWIGIAWEPWIGVWLISSSNNTVSENNITGWSWGVSLWPFSSFNTFSGNNLVDNDVGIVLGHGFSGNYLGDCSNNSMYHNNFIDNLQQAASGGSNV